MDWLDGQRTLSHGFIHRETISKSIVTTTAGALVVQLLEGDEPYALVKTSKQIILDTDPDSMDLTSVSYQLKDIPNLLLFRT
jgi:hypothetical protein